MLFPARWRWIASAGIAGAFGWWIVTVANGCDRAAEVRCGWQPVVAWVFVLLFVAAWLAGVGGGLFLRWALVSRVR